MKLTEREKKIYIAAFIDGYEVGHHDTVEEVYSDAYETAQYVLADIVDEDEIEYVISQVELPSELTNI